DVAVAARGVVGLLSVRRAGRRRAGTGLLHVAGSGRRAADGAGGRGLIRGAVVVHAVAALRDVAHPGGRAADRRALLIGRAGSRGPGAVLGRVARTGRAAAHGARQLEGVGGAGTGRPGAVLGVVADSGAGAAELACRLESIRRAGRARPGAVLGH